ncbi:hypothetical protein [Streptococcus sp. E17BB]|uniref:hypothetical protein n=1 Tax=Streptococcus sp. E17BB TaxID=3278714 RepID=UPI00359DB3E2
MTQRLIDKERQKESHDIGKELDIGLAMTLTILVSILMVVDLIHRSSVYFLKFRLVTKDISLKRGIKKIITNSQKILAKRI